MMWVEDENANDATDVKATVAVEVSPATEAVPLTKDQLYNIIEFIELWFIESIRQDEDVDNIDYVVSMMDALTKFRLAYATLKLEEQACESKT